MTKLYKPFVPLFRYVRSSGVVLQRRVELRRVKVYVEGVPERTKRVAVLSVTSPVTGRHNSLAASVAEN